MTSFKRGPNLGAAERPKRGGGGGVGVGGGGLCVICMWVFGKIGYENRDRFGKLWVAAWKVRHRFGQQMQS
jgi:hypothetical protein